MRPEVGSVEDARAAVVARLRARRGELLGAIFARVQGDAFAGAGAQDAEYLAGLRAAVAAAVDYGLVGIECGEGSLASVPAVVREQARRAARAGVSLDTVLRRYVAGHTLLEEFVMDELEGRGSGLRPARREALRGVLRAQASALDRLLAAITVEHGDELGRVRRSPEQHRAERVRRLLDGDTADRSDLGYDLDGWHLAAIAVGERAEAAVRELAGSVNRRLLSVVQCRDSVWAWLGGREPLARVELEPALASAVVGGVVLALGEPAHGLEGWRLTHRQAQASLLVALRRPGPTGVTRYGDVALLAFALADEPLARSLIEIHLAPLEDERDGGTILLRTLHAYFTGGRNISATAAALDVSRNTVESRLRTIEQRLRRPLTEHLAELEIALRLRELDGLAASEHPLAPA